MKRIVTALAIAVCLASSAACWPNSTCAEVINAIDSYSEFVDMMIAEHLINANAEWEYTTEQMTELGQSLEDALGYCTQ